MAPSSKLKLPGFGLPVGHLPEPEHRFPILIGDSDLDWAASTLTIREVCMLRLIEELTNKPGWWTKVRDPDIASKWKAEALATDWAAYRKYADFTPAMADACIEELKYKAELYEKTNLIPIYDYSACVVKSDSLIPSSLWQALKDAVSPLENVPDHHKDWHPGSDETVLDLVHPSLWPLIYGRTRILPSKRINLQEALEYCGSGEVIPAPERTREGSKVYLSTKFQWLPCDVVIEGGRAKIDSYINNLHPEKHAALYPIIEQFIEKALPAWDVVYRWPGEFNMQRLTTDVANVRCRAKRTCRTSDFACTPKARPPKDDEPPRDVYEDDYSDDEPEESSYYGSDDDDNDEADGDEGALDEGGDEGQDENEAEEELDEQECQEKNQGDKDRVGRANQLHKRSEKDEESVYETEEYDSEEEAKNYENKSNADPTNDSRRISGAERKRRDFRWFWKTHPVLLPDPEHGVQVKLQADDVNSSSPLSKIPISHEADEQDKDGESQEGQDRSDSRRIQVIVKLANIHLTPDKPSYDGGSWHVEGQVNEHICATALFYYDSENVTESHLDFRTSANGDSIDDDNLTYEQYDWRSIARTFAITPTRDKMQDIGSVLTRPGRALFFPNVFQHHVSPFRLADATRPGSRKILALFLVDPAIPVISTANVPPQQRGWWDDQLRGSGGRLPPELMEMVVKNMNDFPIGEGEAKKLRVALMGERTAQQVMAEQRLQRAAWNFCEH